MCEDRTMEIDPPPAHPIDALVERYIAAAGAEKNLSQFTLRNYSNDLRHLVGYLTTREVDPLRLTRLDFRGYLASMVEGGVAQGSVVRRVSTARSFYRWLRLTGVMSDDPLANVRAPKQAKRLPHVLSVEDITAVIAAADGDTPAGLRDRALLELLYAAGVRVSEAATLDVNDVDLEQGTALVQGKGNKQRLAIIGGPARRAIDVYLRLARPKLASKRSDRSTGDDTRDRAARAPALFLNRSGTRMSQRRMQLIVRKYAMKAGLDARVYPHLLRHTFATHMLDGGADLRVVQELMGHSTPNTTQIYLHVTEERQRAAMVASMDQLAKMESARRSSRDRS